MASIWTPGGFLSAFRNFLRVPTNESISAFPDAATRKGKLAGFDAITGDVALFTLDGNVTTSDVNVFTPYDFDPTAGTGGDDTNAVQAALDAAFPVNGTVLLNGNFIVSAVNAKNGIRRIIGQGGKITLLPVVNAGVRLSGILGGQASNVSDCEVIGLRIDANSNPNDTVCIWGQNVSAVRVIGCEITNLVKGYGILLRNHTAGGASGGGNLVARNRVQAAARNTAGAAGDVWGIAVDADPTFSVHGNATELWKQTFTAPGATQFNAGNVITGNRVVGGYYGFMLHGLADSTVTGNNTQNNQRGFSLQNQANGNTVVGNKVFECYSAGIHLAFGSSDNLIGDNEVITSVGRGEALLQAYVGCKRNTFTGNTVISNEATQGNQYGIYVAVHADGNTIKGNTVRGRYFRASIGVESAWRTTLTTLQWHYGNGADPAAVNNMAGAPTLGVALEGNTIFRDTVTACPAIYLGQIRTIVTGISGYTSNYSAALTDTVMRNNTVIGNALNALVLQEDDSTALSGIDQSDNTFGVPDSVLTAAAMATYITLPRGRAHFKHSRSSWPIDVNNSAISLTGATPNVAVGRYFGTANGSTTTITQLLGGADGQEILLRLDSFTGVQYGTGTDNVKLSTGSTLTAGTANADDWLMLRRQAGVWLELARSKPSGGGAIDFVLSETSSAMATTSGSDTALLWDTPSVNTLGSYAAGSGIFTAPVAGLYCFNAHAVSVAQNWPIDTRWELRLYINGATRMRGQATASQVAAGHTGSYYSSLSCVIQLAAGDTAQFRLFQNSGSNINTNSNARDNWMSIARVA